jgi:complex III assembly factor LYRM7
LLMQAGDMNTLFAARAEARKNFESNRALAAGSDELSKQITHAQEVAKFLRENVVQGQAAENDSNYSTPLNAHGVGHYTNHTIELRIHEHTERGDNDDIKKAGNSTLGGVKCCSA